MKISPPTLSDLIVVTFLGIALSTLCSCVTNHNRRAQEDMEANLSTWIGTPVNHLLRSWGPPTRTFRGPDGNDIYVYQMNNGVTAATMPNVTNNPYAPTFTSVDSWWCRKTVFLKGLQVDDIRWEGNNCY